MVYSMLRNRFCERIGREHKSNHSMLSVEISGFIFFFQKVWYTNELISPKFSWLQSFMLLTCTRLHTIRSVMILIAEVCANCL